MSEDRFARTNPLLDELEALGYVAVRKEEVLEVGPPVTVECMPGVIVRPGDVLIIECGSITIDQADRIRSAAMGQLPDLAGVVVLSGAHIGGVYRTEPEGGVS